MTGLRSRDRDVVEAPRPAPPPPPAAAPAAAPPGPGAAGTLDVAAAVRAARPRGQRLQRAIVVASCSWLVLLVVLALTADWLPLRDPTAIGLPPMQPPLSGFPEVLGTDYLGRSVLSQVIYGARVSIGVGVGATLIGMVVGVTLGTLAGYFGGKADAVTMVVLDAMLALPPLVLLLALVAVLTPSVQTLIGTLGFLVVPTFARIARANAMAVGRKEFVLAARVAGASDARIIVREVLPNVMVPITSYAFLVVAWMIVAEGSASFLGLGVPPPTPSWGGMIAAGQGMMATNAWLVVVPAVVLFLSVFSANAVGDRLRARIDAREQR